MADKARDAAKADMNYHFGKFLNSKEGERAIVRRKRAGGTA